MYGRAVVSLITMVSLVSPPSAEPGRLLERVDPVEMMLEIKPTEEEGHDWIETKSYRLRTVEMLFERRSLAVTREQANHPDSEDKQAAERIAGEKMHPRLRGVMGAGHTSLKHLHNQESGRANV